MGFLFFEGSRFVNLVENRRFAFKWDFFYLRKGFGLFVPFRSRDYRRWGIFFKFYAPSCAIFRSRFRLETLHRVEIKRKVCFTGREKLEERPFESRQFVGINRNSHLRGAFAIYEHGTAVQILLLERFRDKYSK